MPPRYNIYSKEMRKMSKNDLTFKETLKEFDETGLPLIKVLVAAEVNFGLWKFDRPISDEGYEALCGFIYNEILESDVNELSFIRAAVGCLYEKTLTLEDIAENADEAAETVYRQMEDGRY